MISILHGIHQWPVDSRHKGPVMWSTFPCLYVIMACMPIVHCNATMIWILLSMIMLSVVYSQYKQFSSIPDVLFVFEEGFIFYYVIAVLHGVILNSPIIRLVNNNKYLPTYIIQQIKHMHFYCLFNYWYMNRHDWLYWETWSGKLLMW